MAAKEGFKSAKHMAEYFASLRYEWWALPYEDPVEDVGEPVDGELVYAGLGAEEKRALGIKRSAASSQQWQTLRTQAMVVSERTGEPLPSPITLKNLTAFVKAHDVADSGEAVPDEVSA